MIPAKSPVKPSDPEGHSMAHRLPSASKKNSKSSSSYMRASFPRDATGVGGFTFDR